MKCKRTSALALLALALLTAPEVAGMPNNTGYGRPSLPAGKIAWRPYTLDPGDSGWVIEGVWPSLYLDRSMCPEVKRKAASLPWARRLVATMRREAEWVLPLPPQVPMEPCGWRHDFFSRTTGAHLRFEPARDDRYLDPTTGKRERDPTQRRAWALLAHERTYRIMNSLAVLYQATGDERYARWVAAGMRLAADYFGHQEFHKGEALFHSPLYDAGMLLLLAGAYDLTRDSAAYAPADHARIRTGIFEERVPSLVRFLDKSGVGNIPCFAAAAISRCGVLLGREDWIARGLRGAGGLEPQLGQGVPTGAGGGVDGFWCEGTMFYHFYALCPLITLYEIARQQGQVDPDLTRRLRAMCEAPVALAGPEGSLPNLGDLGCPSHMNLAAYRHVYEYAAGRLEAKAFGPVLASLYRIANAPRTDWAALAWGPDALPAAGGLPASHSLLPVAQMGTFRATDPYPMRLLFRAGRFRDGHDHPDRLSVFLYGWGRPLAGDLGEPGYSLRGLHHNWYRSTLAHNTLFVDEQDTKGEAALDWRPDAQPAQAQGTLRVGGVTLRRTVYWEPPRVVLVDEWESDADRRLGWAFHAAGPVTGDLSSDQHGLGLPPLPDQGAWANLVKRRTGMMAQECALSWETGEGTWLRMLCHSDRPCEVTLGEAPGNPYADRQGMVVMRVPGRRWRLTTVLEVGRGRGAGATNSVARYLREDRLGKEH